MATKIKVIDYVDVDVTEEANPDDEWSRDSTAESHSIQGIVVKPAGYADVECSFPVLPDTDYYLLYYIYSTGDSFGSDTGKIEFVGLYKDRTLAEKCATQMDKVAGGKCTIWNDQGKPYEEYLNNDYFGGYDYAEVKTVRLVKG